MVNIDDLEEMQEKLNKRIKKNKSRGKNWKVFAIPPRSDGMSTNSYDWGKSIASKRPKYRPDQQSTNAGRPSL